MSLIDKKAKIKKEVYYRNYGCLLERILMFEGKEKSKWLVFSNEGRFQEIKLQYERAINFVLLENKESLREQTFYTYLSLYYKYIKSRNIIVNYLEKRENEDIDFKALEKYTFKAHSYVEIAWRSFPLNTTFWKIKALTERDCTVWAIMHGDIGKHGGFGKYFGHYIPSPICLICWHTSATDGTIPPVRP